tara:strand:- start:466 stop:1410 length:945 start_codon:yes stop_codon:yes gene_type:complete
MENFRAFLNEEPLVEQNTAAIYKYLGLPDYLGGAAIGTGGFRNGEFLQDFTAQEVTSAAFKSSVDEVNPKKLQILINAATTFESETGKKIAAVVISPSVCGPGSHPDCERGVCKNKFKEISFGEGGKCEHAIGGRAMPAPGVRNFIWFVACDGVGGSMEAPMGQIYSVIPTLKGNTITFVPGGVLKTNDFVDGINSVKNVLFDKLEKKTIKSDKVSALRVYKFSPYGKAEKRCNEVFQPGLQPAPFGIIDNDDRFGYGDERVWNFKCASKSEVKLLNADEILKRMTKQGFAYTKEHAKCDQTQKTCVLRTDKKA